MIWNSPAVGGVVEVTDCPGGRPGDVYRSGGCGEGGEQECVDPEGNRDIEVDVGAENTAADALARDVGAPSCLRMTPTAVLRLTFLGSTRKLVVPGMMRRPKRSPRLSQMWF